MPLILMGGPPAVAAADTDTPPGFDPQRHMTVDEVEPGMVGYGLTVYQGTTLETFEVEVVSVERGFQPGQDAVWIRCPGERMQKLGPVSGMSGSPIYLWPAGADPQRRVPGRGGRLIGAFAFGYAAGKDCYVGVQPIEQMLAAAARAEELTADDGAAENGAESGAARGQAPGKRSADGGRPEVLATLWRMAQQRSPDTPGMGRLEALAKLTRLDEEAAGSSDRADESRFKPVNDSLLRPGDRTMTPLQVASAADAELLRPFFEPYGIRPVSGRAGLGLGKLAPQWINPHHAEPEPGGVASVPLVAGDADLAAVGTFTEVLRDEQGQITKLLAFGHAFMGTGEVDLPLGVGYVHFVQPGLTGSFKLGGTLRTVGALVNDEMASVVGRADQTHRLVPYRVTVDWPDDSKDHTFEYEMAQHRMYTPLFAGFLPAMSLTSTTAVPPHSSLEVSSRIYFEGERTLEIDATLPNAAGFSLVSLLAGPASAVADTEFGRLKIERVETDVKVIDEVRAAAIQDLTVRQTVVPPGGKLRLATELRPYRGEPFVAHTALAIPEDLPPGRYLLVIGGADAYSRVKMETQPHRYRIRNLDELFEMVQYTYGLRSDALYTVLVPQETVQVAVGRTELPDLPSSRAAMLLQPSSTQATPYLQTIDQVDPLDYVIQGRFEIPIIVERRPQRQ